MNSPAGRPIEECSMRFLAAVQDIFFAAKITAAAKRVGVTVEFIREPERLLETARKFPSLVIVDLNDAGLDPIELIGKLKAAAAPHPVRIIGYVSHVQSDRIREAQKAGCDLVLPRSVFSQQLDELLRQRSCHPME